MADAQVEVPGLGPMNKNLVYGGVGAAALYVGYRWYRAKSAPPAAAGPADGTGSPDAAGLGAPGVGAPGATPYINPAPNRLGGASSGSSTAGSAPQTDQAWTAAVVQDLQNLGYNPQAVAGAVAAYLASQPLTSDQVTIIRQAWAYEGRPPGHPALNIVQGGTDPGTTPTPTTPAPGTIPQATTGPITMNIGKGHNVGEVVEYAQSHGYPDFTWADFWQFNPNVVADGQMYIAPDSSGHNNWFFGAWSTTITIAKPNVYQSSSLGQTV